MCNDTRCSYLYRPKPVCRLGTGDHRSELMLRHSRTFRPQRQSKSAHAIWTLLQSSLCLTLEMIDRSQIGIELGQRNEAARGGGPRQPQGSPIARCPLIMRKGRGIPAKLCSSEVGDLI